MRSSAFDVEAVFAAEMAKAVANEVTSSGCPTAEWDKGGRYHDQGEEFWLENGPLYALTFIEWFESQDDVAVWITPDGEPAIELDLTADLAGVQVRCVIDLVLAIGKVNPALVVVDLKSGSTRPGSDRQLAIGASVIEATYGIRPRYGSYFMMRKNPKSLIPVELTGPQHSGQYLGGEFRKFEIAVSNDIFLANPGEHCRRCTVAHACIESGNPAARNYDRNYPRRK